MAKRYTRINWKNDATTALGATLLNRMDKGIKDCDDAIGDLALLNTNNKTDLVSAINEQNNNLAQLSGLKVEQFYVDQSAPVNKTYANRALLITGRATRGTKGIYYFEPQSGVLTFFENTDLTVTCTNKVITITNKQATAAYCLLFTC